MVRLGVYSKSMEIIVTVKAAIRHQSFTNCFRLPMSWLERQSTSSPVVIALWLYQACALNLGTNTPQRCLYSASYIWSEYFLEYTPSLRRVPMHEGSHYKRLPLRLALRHVWDTLIAFCQSINASELFIGLQDGISKATTELITLCYNDCITNTPNDDDTN